MNPGTRVTWRNGRGVIVAICDGWAWVRTNLGGFATVLVEQLSEVM